MKRLEEIEQRYFNFERSPNSFSKHAHEDVGYLLTLVWEAVRGINLIAATNPSSQTEMARSIQRNLKLIEPESKLSERYLNWEYRGHDTL